MTFKTKKELGHQIREVRKKKKIKLKDLAQQLGVSRNMLYRVETGTRYFSTPKYLKIISILEIKM